MVSEASSWPAPAKLNLFLHVTRRRADGYHELQTVFQLLDWGDSVDIEITESGPIDRGVDLPGVPAEQDLSLRAARLLQTSCGVTQGARIALTKRIPPGSGLGGASSDAATVLLALNRLWNCGLGNEDLAGLGLQLGADVPLFVHGRSAWAGGIGELLQSVDLGQAHYLLVLPELHVATDMVFADPDLERDSPTVTLPEFLADRRSAAFRNVCEKVVLRQHPELREMLRELAPYGRPRMSGTGSAFFIEMDSKNHVQQAAHELKSRYNVRAVGGVNRSPLLGRLTGGNNGG